MIRLTTGQVILLHQDLIAETGGMDGLRDEGLLDSALNMRSCNGSRNISYSTISSCGKIQSPNRVYPYETVKICPIRIDS